MSNRNAMLMQRLEPSNAYNVLAKYQSKAQVFPLILSVLEGSQEGIVYADGKHANYFVIHKFGFADLIETEESAAFDTNLLHFFLEKQFLNEKIRWYDVPKRWVTKFKDINDQNIQLAERVQLIRDDFTPISGLHKDDTVILEQVTESNFDVIEAHFNLSLGARFWASKKQFLKDALGMTIYKDGVPAALCYACAITNSIAEIDVFTKETFREQGLGRLVTAAFINKCIAKKIKVHWDCYSNNTPSFLLAKSLGFKPYNFYSHAIISK